MDDEARMLHYVPVRLTSDGKRELDWLLQEFPRLYPTASAAVRAGIVMLARTQREKKALGLQAGRWHEARE